jgi:hypothetical protein
MRKCTYSAEREKIVAEAICPVATELRLLDAADLVSLLRFECYGNLADLVSSAAELYFLPGTVNFGAGGDYRLDWDTEPEVTLDMEIRPQGVTVYAKLLLQRTRPAWRSPMSPSTTRRPIRTTTQPSCARAWQRRAM